MPVTNSNTAGRALAPIALVDRIQSLDVIRGLALIGIFLMNVEWFTRPIAELGTGTDISQTGLSYAASWFIYTFIQGKFWTMFSLLFGMGFAVMLGRAETTDRAFVTPYIRRIVGLFLFGSAHFVMIWTGDILHNYAITALLLLLVVTQSWKAWLALLLWVAVLGYAFYPESLATSIGFVAAAAMAAFLVFRSAMDRWYKVGGLVLAAAMGAVSIAPTSPGMAMTAGLLGLVAVLMFALNRGSIDRFYKIGVGMYLFPFVTGLLFVAAVAVVPSLMPGGGPGAAQQRAERMQERKLEIDKEVRVFTTGSYVESLAYRAEEFRKEMPDFAGMSMVALPMFMIGFWFVRSGVITNLRKNLPVFRRLVSWTLPVGLLITLASVWLHASFAPGSGRQNSVALARLLFEIGALPLCIGYVSAMVCLLATRWGERIFGPLRHAGRMALTNYLGASLVGTWYFSGYGLGHYGQVSRAGQVLFVAVVFGLQLLLSYLWLARFRYGPMEWLWRAVTYWQLPPMRRERTTATGPLAPASIA